MKSKSNVPLPLTGKDVIHQYFRCIDNKDVQGALELFDYDAVLHEPFSNLGELRGRSAIEPFIKVALMANSTLRREISIEKNDKNPDMITALVTFEKGDILKGRFTFEFTPDNHQPGGKKIKSLRIEF